MININTDLIIPKQYLKNVTRKGLGDGLFRDLRYLDGRRLDPIFILNKPGFSCASILVVGDNFGCGSSREHAQWALLDKGISCLISTSFANIFHANCILNGILPAHVSEDDLNSLFSICGGKEPVELEVDLLARRIGTPGGPTLPFNLDEADRRFLMEGRDSISRTLVLKSEISDFQRRRFESQPWL